MTKTMIFLVGVSLLAFLLVGWVVSPVSTLPLIGCECMAAVGLQ